MAGLRSSPSWPPGSAALRGHWPPRAFPCVSQSEHQAASTQALARAKTARRPEVQAVCSPPLSKYSPLTLASSREPSRTPPLVPTELQSSGLHVPPCLSVHPGRLHPLLLPEAGVHPPDTVKNPCPHGCRAGWSGVSAVAAPDFHQCQSQPTGTPSGAGGRHMSDSEGILARPTLSGRDGGARTDRLAPRTTTCVLGT